MVAAFSLTPEAARGEDSIATARVVIGFDGYYEVGRWTEAKVTFESPVSAGTRLVVRAPDPDGNHVAYFGEWSAAETDTLIANFAAGRLDIPLELSSESREAGVVETLELSRLAARAVRQDVTLIVTVGEPRGFDAYVGGEVRAGDGTRAVDWRVVPLESVDALPRTALGLQGMDVLVMADGYGFDPARLDALERWVWDGGHLVVAVGENQDSYRLGPLAGAEWFPFDVGGEPLRLSKLDVLQTFAKENAVIPMLRQAIGARFTVPDDPDVEVLAEVYGDPILARAVHGFGHITFLAVELHRPPLSEWNGGIETLARRLVEVGRESRQAGRGDDRRLAHSGINDIGTQLNAVQEDFDGVNRSSRWTVMGLVLFYIVLIGPLDYLFVHRVLKRPEWTWATFPLVALVGTVLGFVTASSTNGSELYANQFELIDVDADSGRMRGLELATVYSPENRRYEVTADAANLPAGQVTDALAATPPVVNWVGLPEDAYGGMYRTGGLRLGGLGYRELADGPGFANVPIPVWSTKPFRAEWTQEVGSAVVGSLEDEGFGRLVGRIEWNLDLPLEDWLLAYGNRLYRPKADEAGNRPPLEQGEPWNLSVDTEPRDLRHYLTRTTSTRIEGRREIDTKLVIRESDYDALDRDPRRLVEILTFHEVVGGRGYTGLENDLYDRLDLSTLLLGGRAVLLGRTTQPLADLQVNGQPVHSGRRTSFVRVVFPVEK